MICSPIIHYTSVFRFVLHAVIQPTLLVIVQQRFKQSFGLKQIGLLVKSEELYLENQVDIYTYIYRVDTSIYFLYPVKSKVHELILHIRLAKVTNIFQIWNE